MNSNIDLTVISSVLMADGIGRQGIGIIDALSNDLTINALQLEPKIYKDVPPNVLKVLIKPFNTFGKVAFWTSIIGLSPNCIQSHKNISSPLKISYSMFESDAIPDLWVNVLNSYYDIVVVPDNQLVQVYINSGVKIPIFVIPLGIYVEDLLKKPIKTVPGNPFTFGMSAGFWKRKNHIKLLQAFSKKFGNNNKFKLKLHGRFGPYKSEVEKAIISENINNVELSTLSFSVKDYNEFMDEIDCYVLPSMGEGFSITPREVMALGKPCIVSNNTSQKTICDSTYVVPLKSNKKIPAIYEVFGNKIIGNYYDCNTDDLSNLMGDVYENYDQYLQQSQKGRDWVKQYLWSELKDTYLNLVKPSNILLGNTNKIDNYQFQTNDKNLFKKMKELFT